MKKKYEYTFSIRIVSSRPPEDATNIASDFMEEFEVDGDLVHERSIDVECREVGESC